MAIRKASPVLRPANLSLEQMRAGIKKLQRRIDEMEAFNVNLIQQRHDPALKVLFEKLEGTLQDIFGADSIEYRDYGENRIDTLPLITYESPSLVEIKQASKGAINSALLRLQGIRELFEERIDDSEPTIVAAKPAEIIQRALGRRVFVVHGHDDGMKQAVARFLTKLKLDPVILHEAPNKGKTIIEKFEAYSNVDFAVVLLSPDDTGHPIGKSEAAATRARQNVIMELGFFIGKLGRHKVCALYVEGVEIPSDYAGVLFVPFDPKDRWHLDVAKELRAGGLSINLNDL